jgi:hypothetical protein
LHAAFCLLVPAIRAPASRAVAAADHRR